MGVGYGKDIATHHEYYDPRTSTNKNIPFPPARVEEVYPRPDLDDVIIEL